MLNRAPTATACAALILLAGCESPKPLPEGEATKQPRGYEQFCERNPNSPLC